MTIKQILDRFVLGTNLLMILLGLMWGAWSSVAWGAAMLLLYFGIPHIIDKVRKCN